MSRVGREEPDTRTRILEATRLLMERRQGRGVRMQDVADAAGISRQAVYDHFGSRTNLIMATTRYVDNQRELDRRKERFEAAATGEERLETYVEFWGNYIPEIYGIARALLADRETDEAAAAAWDDRMGAVRTSCRIIIESLDREGNLVAGWTVDEATDLLWTMLSIRNWEHLTIDCGWTPNQYVGRMKELTRRALVAGQSDL